MLSDIIRRTALHLLVYGLRTRDPKIIRAYWDLVYLYRYGLPEIPIPGLELIDVWRPPQPQPDPSPMHWNIGYESLLANLVDVALGDPHPQPSSFIKLFGDPQIRITAAKNVLAQFEQAIPQLKEEVRRLEQMH